MISRQFTLLLFILGLVLNVMPAAAQRDHQLRVNEIQVIGTHNSYHAGFAPSAAALWQARNPNVFNGLDYRHQPLEDPNGVMAKPGFKVMHVHDIDYRSTRQPFTGCFEQVRHWSHAHPGQIPIFILVETKQRDPQSSLHLTEPESFTSSTFDALDAEIRSIFPPNELLTPDDVRGNYDTLNQAVLAGNWPTLASARGKVIFLMDQRPVDPVYLAGHPSLRGRVLFTNAGPGEPESAFIERNDGPASEISVLVRKGYLVRSRTDADTKGARTNSTTRRDAMLASGAQMLSTDYPVNEPARLPGHFTVTLPSNTAARCNPVNSSAACSTEALK